MRKWLQRLLGRKPKGTPDLDRLIGLIMANQVRLTVHPPGPASYFAWEAGLTAARMVKQVALGADVDEVIAATAAAADLALKRERQNDG